VVCEREMLKTIVRILEARRRCVIQNSRPPDRQERHSVLMWNQLSILVEDLVGELPYESSGPVRLPNSR
jgi:hypothetical protein